MDLLKFNADLCNLCGECIKKCPFGALHMEENGVVVKETCRMCGVCIKVCPKDAIHFEQKAGSVEKDKWNGILVYAEQENGKLHPIVLELIGEAKRLAKKVNYSVYAVIVGETGTYKNAEELLNYGVDKVYAYEQEGFYGYKADCYTDAVADCIASIQPSVVLIGGTALGRSLAPCLSTRFHTGLTADCTELDIRENTDLIQVRPAFGGNIMAQIIITDSRPQFATVRYKVMDRADKVAHPTGTVVKCEVSNDMARSGITVEKVTMIPRSQSIEEEEILVVAGRGVKNEKELAMVQKLADVLGGQLCFTRPMVEAGYGDTTKQIGLSGRTVKPKLLITCGVSGAIQFTAGISNVECMVAINNNPEALIFQKANYCMVDDFTNILPDFIEMIRTAKEAK